MKEEKKSILLRVYVIYIAILLFSLAIIGRVIMIYSLEGKELLAKAKKQDLAWVDVEAIRGNICSDDGTLLATSIPIFDIRMDLRTDSLTDAIFRKGIDSLAIRLANLFGDRTAAQYRTALVEARQNNDRFYLVKRKVTYPQLRELRTFPIFRRGQFKGGLIVIPHYQRELPYRELAMRTIGYESQSEASRVFVGLEGYFSDYLQGVTGKRLMRRIGSESWVPVDNENELEPQNGDDIITTIDINIQDLTEQALLKELIADSADHGCAVVMEVKTGHVKAIANLGRKEGQANRRYEEQYNYAVGESSEPGSTFKLASFLVALEDGKITLNTPVSTGNGKTTYHGRTMSDSHRGGYGTITAGEVFALSSNVGTSMIITNAYKGNPQQFIDGLHKLGIHQRLGLQMNGEGHPNIKNTSDKFWSKLSLPWMSIGYEVALTPLQVLTLYNAVANNGVMVKPLFVEEIRRNGQPLVQYPVEVINPAICSPSTLASARIILQQVVEKGTATNIKNPVYSIAGKTGTAQVAKNNKGYGQGTSSVEYKASFVGFFPADDPKYSIIVVINNPSRKKYYGSSVAGPVFKEIADQLYARHPEILYAAKRDTSSRLLPLAKAGQTADIKAIYQSLGIGAYVDRSTKEYTRTTSKGEQVILVSDTLRYGLMPDITGMGLRDALYLLESKGLKVTVTGKGFVTAQSISPGLPVSAGQVIAIELTQEKKPIDTTEKRAT